MILPKPPDDEDLLFALIALGVIALLYIISMPLMR